MRLESKLTTVIALKLTEKLVRDKLDYNVAIRLSRLRTTVLKDKMHVKSSVDLGLTKEKFGKLPGSVEL